LSARDLAPLLREAGAALALAAVRHDLVAAIEKALGERVALPMPTPIEDEDLRMQRAQQMEQVHDLLRKRGALPAAEIVRALPMLGHELQAEALLQDFVQRGWLDAHKDGCARPPRLQLGLDRGWMIDLEDTAGGLP
jgi:hypothetical protein